MRVFTRGVAIVFVAALGAAGCATAPVKTASVPVKAIPAVSSVFVRNASNFDVNVYAMPTESAEPVWLATVPPKSSWQVPIPRKAMQSDGQLVIRTQAIGATRPWTSNPVTIDGGTYGLLDLSVSASGDCSMSALRSVNAVEFTPWM